MAIAVGTLTCPSPAPSFAFVLAGPLGLWINYWARYYGWRGTWITIGISIALVVFLVAAGGSLTGCQEGWRDGPQGYGYYTCN